MSKYNIVKELKRCGREEEVKYAYASWLDLRLDTSHNQDHISSSAIWEFKYKKNLRDKSQLARVLAQAVYYLRRLKLEGTGKNPLPQMTVAADVNEASVIATENLEGYFESNVKWDRAPSDPDPVLVQAIAEEMDLPVYDMTNSKEAEGFKQELNRLEGLDAPKKQITLLNFEDAYEHWSESVGKGLDTDKKGWCFIADLSNDSLCTVYNREKRTLQLSLNQRAPVRARVDPRDYEKFWSIWARPPEPADFQTMINHMDRLSAMADRRITGEFYTPKAACRKALEYLEKELGKDWQDQYYVWDPAAGTGQLTYYMDRQDRCFISTVKQSEIDYIEEYGIAPEANVFQYDFVNDDIEKLVNGDDLLGDGWKMPKELRKVLKEEPENLIVLMNPPYGECGAGGAKGSNKKDITGTQSKTSFGDAGKASRELYTQFLLRSSFHKAGLIALFSTLKIVNTTGYKKVRELMPYTLETGYLIHSELFHGVKGKFPIGYHILKQTTTENNLMSNEGTQGVELGAPFELDVLEMDKEGILNKTGSKTVGLPERDVLNKWCKSPKASEEAVPLKSSIQVAYDAWKTCKLAKNATGYMICGCNDLQHAVQGTFLLSSVQKDPKGWSVTPDNLRKSAIIFAVRKSVKQTWLNNQDQFTVPHTEPDDTFYGDCLVYALFHNSNQTSSLKDVVYEGETYQIRNQFYPYHPKYMKEDIKDLGWYNQFDRARPTAIYWELRNLQDQGSLSVEAETVLEAGKEVYSLFNKYIDLLDCERWKIDYWDAGWYQIRNSLKGAELAAVELERVKEARNKLEDKIRPQVYELGFLRE